MDNSINTKWIVEISAALFILLFLYTSINKFYEHRVFQLVLSKSPLLGNSAEFISYFIPTAEIVIAFLLLLPRTRLIGLWSSLVLMIVFTVYIGYMLASAERLPCSCGGILKQLKWKDHLLFNLFFVALAATALYSEKRKIIVYTNRRSRKPA